MTPALRTAIVTLLIVVAGILGVTLVVDNQPSTPALPDGPGAVEQHIDLRDPPDNISAAALARGRELDQATAAKLAPPPRGLAPRAAPAPCRTRLNHNNLSQRTSPILIIVAHRVVAPNRPGWGDVYGVADFLDRPPTRASANAIIDGEGNCLITVRASDKAWHAAAFNNVGYGVELMGNPGDPITSRQWDVFAQLVGPLMAQRGIPVRKAAIAGAGVAASGVTDHRALGAAGGGHYDIKTCPACSQFTVDPLLARLRGHTSHLQPVERAVATKRCYHRAELVAGRYRWENLKWARFYRDRILIPARRTVLVGGHVQLVTAIDRAKAADRRPWGYRHRGSRRAELLNVRAGKGC